MIYLFIPFYNSDKKRFRESLAKQTVEYKEIRRDRKADKIYWSKACNDFYEQIQKYRGVKDEDTICIMNNDISFDKDLFECGSEVKLGEILIPRYEGVTIDWSKKKFYNSVKIDCFPGRCFFMTYKDFIESGGFSKFLPHYLSDYDFSIRQINRGLKPYFITASITHHPHTKEMRPFTMISPNNPIFWSIFLVKHFNRYAFINIIKAWVTAFRRKSD